MLSSKEYKKIAENLLYKVKIKGIHDKEKQVLTGILMLAWRNYKHKINVEIQLIDFHIERIISTIEDENSSLKEFFKTLVTYNVKDKELELQLVKEIFKELSNINHLSLECINRIINHVILFNDGSRHGSECITPRPIQELFIRSIAPEIDIKVADYFSGVGATLLKIGNSYRKLGVELYGEEKNIENYLMSQILLLINEVENYNIKNKDVYDFNNIKKDEFDYVFIDGPFSINLKNKLEDESVLSYGVPNKTRVDWASYQLGLYSLNSTGKASVTGPMSVLDRLSDRNIRKKAIEEDIIEAIIKLPSRLYASTNIPVVVIIFNKNKNIENTNKIIIIDASDKYISKSRGQNDMTSESIDEIINCINFNQEVEGFSMLVHIDNIYKNDFNLNPSVYFNERMIKNKLGKTKYLGDVAKIVTGVQLSKTDMEYLKVNPTHYYLNIKNIEDDEIIYDEEDKIRDKNIDWHNKYSIESGDIIMTTKGTTNKMLIVPEDFKDSFISNNLTIIRVNKDKYDPYVLLKYLRSDIGKLVLENATSGISMRVIAASKLSDIKAPDYEFSFMKSMGERIKKNDDNYKKKLFELKENFEKENERIMKTLEIGRMEK